MGKQHFSHRHPLTAATVAEDDGAICSGCELRLSGAAYKCVKPKCEFHLHELCFGLPTEIQHASHPKHPLTLAGAPPYAGGEFACDACGDVGSGFIYRCHRCQFDLHIQCATLPEIVKTKCILHHPLRLVHSLPNKEKEKRFCCRVCEGGFGHGCWLYYCNVCDYGVHIDCLTIDEDEETEEDEEIIV